MEKIKTTNPYSGQSIDLTQEESILYKAIKTAEVQEDYERMQKRIDKFSRLNPKAYMVLVD
jgi:hypothetical protein